MSRCEPQEVPVDSCVSCTEVGDVKVDSHVSRCELQEVLGRPAEPLRRAKLTTLEVSAGETLDLKVANLTEGSGSCGIPVSSCR